MSRGPTFFIVLFVTLLAQDWRVMSQIQNPDQLRQQSRAQMREGNFRVALSGFQRLCLQADNREVARDLDQAVECLEQLGEIYQVDELLESTVALHAQDWRLLKTAAEIYRRIPHEGVIIAGRFHRGPHRGGGQVVSAVERDRVQALRLLWDATRRVPQQEQGELAQVYLHLADSLVEPVWEGESWRLLTLTDLTRLPDYERGWSWRRLPNGLGHNGAPVDERGEPIFHRLPDSWDQAQTDGERWRWALAQAERADRQVKNSVRLRLADFAEHEFGVQTLAPVHILWRQRNQHEDTPRTATLALDTLADNETIARLATGVRRFTLPDDYNPIHLLQQIAAEPESGSADTALERLAAIFENRRQFPRAAQYWREVIRRFGRTEERAERLHQIEGNWCRFQMAPTQAAGSGAVVDLVFRNGRKVSFQAQEILLEKWLADLKAYLRSNPRQLQWERFDVHALGWRLVSENGASYLGKTIAQWDMDLTPADNHFDKQITVTTPLQKPGAYLLTARMAGGNQTRVILWVADLALVHKPMAHMTMYFVADARTGEPVKGANVEFFGYRWDYRGNTPRITTRNFAEKSDDNGLVLVDGKRLDPEYQWLAVARTDRGQLAFTGFSGAWVAEEFDPWYDAVKVFGMSDRPVYRPGHRVQFHVWVARARYDYGQQSEFAGRRLKLTLVNPRGEELWKNTFQADEYGGISGSYDLPRDATLGVYYLSTDYGPALAFRVEEYKKPEFEVHIEAPEKPVMLGEQITATIRAKYYYGAPVTQGTVKYIVRRTAQDVPWFPLRPWDWCYGPGYWWFAYEYDWYPGWEQWVGCRRPILTWWPRPAAPPEVVAEAELPIGSDGTVAIHIDTTWVKENLGHTDHQYTVVAEVRDPSRRTIVAEGSVLVARKPFSVYVWLDRGYYRVGDVITASAQARTADGRPVKAHGKAVLYRVTYSADRTPIETAVWEQPVATDDTGHVQWKLQASQQGQYRLVCELTDAEQHTIQGGYVFTVIGEGFDGRQFRFNSLELVPDRAEYAPGDRVQLLVNTDHAQATVLLFVRPVSFKYPKPQVLRLRGKSQLVEIAVGPRDMPNFFVEAVTIFGGKFHYEVREIIVPPEQRVLNVKAEMDQAEYLPGGSGKLKLQVTDLSGEAVNGSVVAAIYDKAVEYISGGTNVPDIREHFWKWRREHHPQHETNLLRSEAPIRKPGEPTMEPIGVFGHELADELLETRQQVNLRRELLDEAIPLAAEAAVAGAADMRLQDADRDEGKLLPAQVEPTVTPELRKEFADTALWITTPHIKDGRVEWDVKFPQDITTWKIRVWTMAHGTRVGVAEAEVVTRKNVFLRMQIPRFAVQGDEMTLSANVHNELPTTKNATVAIQVSDDLVELLDAPRTSVTLEPHSQTRVDWRVRIKQQGIATVRMDVLTDVESDAVEMPLPCHVHGIRKTESWAGSIRPDQSQATLTFRIPQARRPEQSRLELRYSPSLALAMVDALPYLLDYPYGCTEQTLNRFLPAVLTQKVLIQLGLDLEQLRQRRSSWNPQEIGDTEERRRQWKRWDREPVFDRAELERIVRASVERLTNMQNADGGWNWFAGWDAPSDAHITAQIVRGLLVAEANDVPLVPDVLSRGVQWLQQYEEEQVKRIRNADGKVHPWKPHPDDLDAFVRHVLAEAGVTNTTMREYLFRDRNKLSVYGKALFALSVQRENIPRMLNTLMQNLEQYLVTDPENETAFLKLPGESYWWMWYGDEIETQAAYLKLLSRVDPAGPTASRLVKYLLNNRKHATYWRSTRDTALCVEAFAEYLRASQEMKPDMIVEIWLDGTKKKEVSINADTLFVFDNTFVLTGTELEAGEHTLELRRRGTGPLYFNVYSTYFTLEDYITAAGLEIKVQRKYYKLLPEKESKEVAGQRGQPILQRTEKYRRVLLQEGDRLASGDLLEVEFEISSKNDYEYVMMEDWKPAGCEPVAVRSGYLTDGLPAYLELRDDRVALFLRHLARGDHSVSYRLRAEVPGRFSALPVQATGMYAPELQANSHEAKISIVDAP